MYEFNWDQYRRYYIEHPIPADKTQEARYAILAIKNTFEELGLFSPHMGIIVEPYTAINIGPREDDDAHKRAALVAHNVLSKVFPTV